MVLSGHVAGYRMGRRSANGPRAGAMHDTFDLTQVTGEARLVFDHAAAQAHFGASIFWLRQLAALSNEQESILSWQIKRDGGRRGIVQVTEA